MDNLGISVKLTVAGLKDPPASTRALVLVSNPQDLNAALCLNPSEHGPWWLPRRLALLDSLPT